MLLGMEGVTVTGAEEGPGGQLAVWARVSRPAVCPRCGTVSGRVHEYVTTRPRDVRYGSRDIDLFLEKRRLACGNGACPRGTFTEWAPQVPPRCRITRRLLEHCGDEVAERGITPAESARHNGLSWPSAHAAFGEKADAALRDDPEPVAHLGIDEHRRGRARWRRDEETGEYACTASELASGAVTCCLAGWAGCGKIAVCVPSPALPDHDPGLRLAGAARPQPGVQRRGDHDPAS